MSIKLTLRRSWVQDAEGNVFAATGDPSKREHYRETVMHNNFKEVHKDWLLLKQSSECSFSEFSNIIAGFSLSTEGGDLQDCDPSDGHSYASWTFVMAM